MFLKQSTAQSVVIGPVLDADGVAVTTAVITNFSLAKNGTAAAFTTETLTSLGNGYYSLALTTSNTNTLGIAAVFANASTMSMTVFRWNVIAASVYDAIVSTATNASGGLLTATGAISALSGAILNTNNLPTNFSSLAITAGGATTVGTNNDKTGYSLTATTGLGNQTANITGNLSGSVGSVTSGVTVTTNNDKTGYSLSSAAIQAIWDALTSALTSVGSVGKLLVDNVNATISSRLPTSSYTAPPSAATNATAVRSELATELARIDVATSTRQATVAFPTNFSTLVISGTGRVTVGSLDNNVITESSIAADAITSVELASSAVNEIRDAIFNASPTAGWTNGSFGDRLIISNNNNRTIGITGSGSGHVQVVVHEMNPDVLTASALAADAVAEIQAGLATYAQADNITNGISTLLSRITTGVATLFSDLIQMITGSTTINARWTVKALENAPGTDAQTIAEAVETQLQDDFAAINLDEESVATLVYESLIGSSVARSQLPVAGTAIDAVKYADFNLDIQAGTSASSRLVVSIGCENHTNPNIEVSSDSGLVRLNSLSSFESSWGSVTRESPTQVAFHLSVNAFKQLSAGEYLIELREITASEEVISKKEYTLFLRSGVGRIID